MLLIVSSLRIHSVGVGVPQFDIDFVVADRLDELPLSGGERFARGEDSNDFFIPCEARDAQHPLELVAGERHMVFLLARSARRPLFGGDGDRFVGVDHKFFNNTGQLLRLLQFHFPEGEVVHIPSRFHRKIFAQFILFTRAHFFDGAGNHIFNFFHIFHVLFHGFQFFCPNAPFSI